MAKKAAKQIKVIGKKAKPAPATKSKTKPKKKETKPKVAAAPQLEERLKQLKLEKKNRSVEVRVVPSRKPRPVTVERLPENLVQVPFKRVKPGGVFFHRKVELTKIADLCPTIKTGEIGLLGLPIEVPVSNGVSHFGTARTKEGEFKFRFNEYENVFTYPICINKG